MKLSRVKFYNEKKVRYGKMTHVVCAASKQTMSLQYVSFIIMIVRRTKGSKMSEPPDDCGE